MKEICAYWNKKINTRWWVMKDPIFETYRDTRFEKNDDVIFLLSRKPFLQVFYSKVDTHEVYEITNLRLFEHFIRRKLAEYASKRIIVGIIFEDIDSYITALLLLNSIDYEGLREKRKAEYIERFNQYENLMLDSEVLKHVIKDQTELPLGVSDRPIAFELVTIIDSAKLRPFHLRPAQVSLLQLVRFLCLKHGGSLVCMEHVSSGSQTLKRIIDLLQLIGRQNLDDKIIGKSIFAFLEQTLKAPGQANLFIPRGCDSWDKILLLSKSLESEKNDSDYILESENDVASLNSKYNHLLDAILSKNDDEKQEFLTHILFFDRSSRPQLDTVETTLASWQGILKRLSRASDT